LCYVANASAFGDFPMMASAFTHAFTALAIGTAFQRPGPPARFWLIGAACAALPDLDFIGFRLGIPYNALLGHRGLTHSLPFAALIATVTLALFPRTVWPTRRAALWMFLFLATASHGVLDAMTTGGGGVAFLSPFDTTRHVLPWRPILVSPLSVGRFFSGRGLAILSNELRWVWLPGAVFAALMIALRERRAPVERSREG
jgi:inner membrane protein